MALLDPSATKLIAFQLSGAGKQVANSTDATYYLQDTISRVIGILTIVAVVFFAIQIILAGYSFMSSEGDKNKMETARKRLTDGVLGLFIVIIALGFASLIANLAGLGNVFDLNSLNIWSTPNAPLPPGGP
ncbi:MAG TPA: hypothetical protein VF828_01595 [Patescibacteria group bacterium]